MIIRYQTTPSVQDVARYIMEKIKVSELSKLKTSISEEILSHIADKLDMTVGEYGKVYDSEKHEALLNKIVRQIIVYDKSIVDSALFIIQNDESNLFSPEGTVWKVKKYLENIKGKL